MKQLLEEVKYKLHVNSHGVLQINEINNDKKYYLFYYLALVPKDEKLIRSMKKALKSKLPDNTVIMFGCEIKI